MNSQKKPASLFQKIIYWEYTPYLIIVFFFICYSTLSILKHNNFMSGYDLAMIDQAIWKYSQFKNPITTTHTYFDLPIYFDHLEIIYIFMAPIYWIINDVRVLLIFQVLAICSSSIIVFWLTVKYKLEQFLSLSILVSYLSFFGLQFAIWSDIHSLVFAVAFLSCFIYFLYTKRFKLSLLFFTLSIFSKEDIALITFLISLSFYKQIKISWIVFFALTSLLYLYFVFYVYFPGFSVKGYTFANPQGLLSDLNPLYLINTHEKQMTIIYSLAWFGFIPILSLLKSITFLGDIAHYFILGNTTVKSAHGIFQHYRSTTALFLVWPTIEAISKYKILNRWYTGLYLLLCAAFFQYYLHLPLSYLTKKWFWTKSSSVSDINKVLERLPKDASVATQVNIAPHITHRDHIYTLWPSNREFAKNSPCGQKNCKWFRIGKTPQYIVVDTSSEWDERHFLTTKDEFVERIEALKKANLIKAEFTSNNATLYKVISQI